MNGNACSATIGVCRMASQAITPPVALGFAGAAQRVDEIEGEDQSEHGGEDAEKRASEAQSEIAAEHAENHVRPPTNARARNAPRAREAGPKKMASRLSARRRAEAPGPESDPARGRALAAQQQRIGKAKNPHRGEHDDRAEDGEAPGLPGGARLAKRRKGDEAGDKRVKRARQAVVELGARLARQGLSRGIAGVKFQQRTVSRLRGRLPAPAPVPNCERSIA